VHVITYTRQIDGVFFHGTLSDLDGKPRATWSFDHGGKRVRHEQWLDAATFRKLWNGFGQLAVFRRHRVDDPDREMDWKNYHAILITFGEPGKPRQHAFLVPPDEPDPELRDWLETLDIPNPKIWAKRQAVTAKNPNSARREKVYAEFFGEKVRWFPDEEPEGPQIGVYVFEPGHEDERSGVRDYYTLVTGGMSDVRMRVPKGVEFRRAELILYVKEPTDEQIEMLRWLAKLPLTQEETWYGPGTTMTNGSPPRPIFDGSDLDCYLFLHALAGEDGNVHEELVLDGDATVLLWVVPITNAECQFILDNEVADFLKILERKKYFLLDETRRSYVRGKDDRPRAGYVDDDFEEFALAFTGEVQGDGEIAFPERLDQDRLDFSLPSLKVLDTYLDYLHRHRRHIDEDAWHLTVLRGGAYLGEVIRRNAKRKYHWVEYDQYVSRHPDVRKMIPERSTATAALLCVPKSDVMTMPLNKIARFIEEGPENSTHYYASVECREK
jgi:hypothetical protein